MSEKLKPIMRQIITICAVILCIINVSSGKVPAVTLKTGAKMPLVGYGTWQALDVELENALDRALQIGYRHIDTATVYKNEHVIGRVLKKWFTSGKLRREDVFVTTKLPFTATHPDLVSKQLQESLEKLQLTYVDMYLIHAPFYFPEGGFNLKDGSVRLDVPTDLPGTWKSMEAEYNAGRAKAIGVSNFNESQVQRIMTHGKIQPANLQIELHVYLQQKSLVEFCQKNGIAVTSFGSLGSRGTFETLLKDKTPPPNLLEDKVIIGIAENHGKSASQILLKYLVQKNIIVIPKSTNEKRMRQNFEIFDFQLTAKEMEDIANLDKGEPGRILRISQHIKGLEKHPEYPYGY